ncbi:hypothetical protein [uncultured Microbulbifer sp.]|uniref:hypothetical protein n=1 Tax=uncultured Microbulbifer sp. TaxID=348147 RepID=UPI0026340706|nr:hypothetical protein [uncultured Microbulbifer sp.]
MDTTHKQKLPLFFLIYISAFWGFYYQGNNSLNEFGTANFEWLYLTDGLLALPILCFICLKDKKEAALKAALMCCLVILIGSYIIPQESKIIWPYFEAGRYLILMAFLSFELATITTVYLAIKSALKQGANPELAISQPIKRMWGDTLVARLLTFEARMWVYALFSSGITISHFHGEKQFSYHKKDGAQSTLKGFIILIALELPFVHVLLHFIWTPFAACIVTALTAFGLIFFIAEYKAVSRRPISLTRDSLVIRYGIYEPRKIPLSNICSIAKCYCFIPRSRFVKRYNYSGTPNIVIQLVQPQGDVKRIYLGVDSPELFMKTVNESKQLYNQALQPKNC